MGTHYPSTQEIKHDWLLVDLNGLTVGRAASCIATLLRGKHKTTLTPHMDVGDFVVCINADKVKFTGNKLDQQTYHRFGRKVGHLKSIPARTMMDTHPEQVIINAVKRMLPRSPLGRDTFSKLKVYAGAEHPHTAQQPRPFQLPL